MRECLFIFEFIFLMKKCAILTMDNIDKYVQYDTLLNQPMIEAGWNIEYVCWREKGVNWSNYLVVIIRSTWDYQDDTNAFLQVLKKIDESSSQLLNSLKIVKWNINKKYLQELEESGVEIVPTFWLEKFNINLINDYYSLFNTNQIVIKPTISAGADNTFWLKKDSYNTKHKILEESLKGKQLMVQPFIPAVIEEGEYSLFYFSGNYSHCILKTPKSGDFRVQEEFGSTLLSIKPSASLLKAAEIALNAIPEKVLYARIDLVSFNGTYKLMELELIEPSLYFNLDINSPARFVKAFYEWMK